MRLSEILDYVMVESGQWVVGDLDDLSLSYERFWVLCRSVLNTYHKSIPYTKSENIYITKSYTFQKVWDDDSLPLNERTLIKDIPSWVSSVLPVGYSAITNMALGIQLFQSLDNSKAPQQPTNWIWRYEEPTLYVPYTGELDVRWHSNYPYQLIKGDSGLLVDVDIQGLQSDEAFFKIMTGKFLQAIGRSRRAFTLTDIPVNMDSDSLVSEGKDLEAEGRELLEARTHWHFAIGN